MKKQTFSLLIVLLVLAACNEAPQQSATSPLTVTAAPQYPDSTKLNGAWQLRLIDGKQDSFQLLFPGKNPFVSFIVSEKRVSGNTGCNSFGGEFTLDGSRLLFDKPMAMTKMFCQGNGENIFVSNLQRVRSYQVLRDTTLQLISGDTVIMSFDKSHTP